MTHYDHLFKVGQEVVYLSQDFYFEKPEKQYGVVTEAHPDHIIVKTDLFEHLWFDDCNIGSIRPIYNF